MVQANSVQIEVRSSGFFTTHHFFETESEILGELVFPAFKSQARFYGADGRELVMKKASSFKGRYEMTEGEMRRGTAHQRGLLSNDLVIQFDGQAYTLKPEGVFKQGWLLIDAEGNELLKVRPRGFLKSGLSVTVTGPLDLDLVVWACYLAHVRQQEAAAAASAAA